MMAPMVTCTGYTQGHFSHSWLGSRPQARWRICALASFHRMVGCQGSRRAKHLSSTFPSYVARALGAGGKPSKPRLCRIYRTCPDLHRKRGGVGGRLEIARGTEQLPDGHRTCMGAAWRRRQPWPPIAPTTCSGSYRRIRPSLRGVRKKIRSLQVSALRGAR